MDYEVTVREKVTEFIQGEKMFTSVDVANAVKNEGLWVRNRDVRDWLQENFTDKNLFGDYVISQIHVCNGSSFASLYHPGLIDPNDYVDRNQRPLTPDEVQAIAKAKTGTVKDTGADLNKILANDDDDDAPSADANVEMSTILTSTERLKIPGAMVKALGWIPGQIIDPALILTSSVLSATLKVNDDYRVSIPRTAVAWGTYPVKVILKNGKIKFEKAK